MLSASRVRRPLAGLAGVAVVALLAGGALAEQDKKDKDKDKADTSRKVKFNTYDGVELSGTFYPKLGNGKDKDACVLLLHNFDRIKGGNSHQDGWDHLAEELQKEGYTVLSFDFRGFGDSRQVAKEQFWDRVKARHNQMLRGAGRMPDNIEFKEFPPAYYPNLVNDIAAARAYLDHKNNAREVNTSNLILVGAGEGATLGSLWLESECKRKRMRGYLPDGRPDLDEPESRDVACAVWLSLNPALANIRQPSLMSWLADAGGEHRIPIGFLYGGDDQEAKGWAKQCVSAIANKARGKNAKLEFTAAQDIRDTNLKGSQLLTKALGTEQMIVNYLDRVVEKRGAKEARSRDPLKTAYVWSFKTGMPITAKTEQEDLLRAVPLSQLGVPGQ
jgi:pimeloyl-ACP methyl ester carboxylesterase